MSINATLIAQMIVFAILIWFTMKFIWPPLQKAMEERARRIEEGLSAAERARKELADADAKVEDDLRKARAEAAAIIERAHQQASRIVEESRDDAKAEGARQKSLAQADIETMVHQARDQLRDNVAILAVRGAERILKREVDASAHQALLDDLVTELGD